MSLLVAGLLLLACRNRAEQEHAQEFATLSQAIDRLREAPNEAKRRHLEALQRTSCSRWCELRRICLRGYEAHVRALRRIDAVRARVGEHRTEERKSEADEVRATEPETKRKGLRRRLRRAKGELDRARELTQKCAAAEAETRQQLGLR